MNTSRKLSAAVAAAMAIHSVAQAAVAEKASTLADQRSVAVTIYNENLALIKDTRQLALDQGVNRYALREVSGQMRPETAALRSLSHPGALSLLEQNFDFDLLTPAKLLEKYVGREVRIVRTHPATGIETVEKAIVLAANGPVLRIGDRIETGATGRIVYGDVPPNLRDRPTLVSQMQSARAGNQTVELSYLSGGLSWKADYVAELNAADTMLSLNGWVTLTNRSGTTYPDAKLQLVAGDVNRVRTPPAPAPAAVAEMRYAAAKASQAMVQESLFEYHLYTLQRPTTIADNQTKQVALLGAPSVPVTKELVLQGADYYYGSQAGQLGQKLKVGVFVQFENREAAGLGIPMPKGVVRVYKKDGAGNAQFVGEDAVDHTPKNEKVRLKLGEAFDVTADKKQTDFKRRDIGKPWTYSVETAYEIELKNAKKEPQTVVVREPVPGDWSMLQESHKHAKVAAGTAEWKITVPPEGNAKLSYRVLVRY